jgi:hypothetical protein
VTSQKRKAVRNDISRIAVAEDDVGDARQQGGGGVEIGDR